MAGAVDQMDGSGRPLRPASVDILVWRCDGGDTVTANLKRLLDADELARASRFVSQRLASLFIQAHGGLRLLLADVLKGDPASLRFSAGAAGKPVLVSEVAGSVPAACELPTVHFNLSHSGHMAALAICPDLEVGLDIEVFRGIDEGLARRFFNAREADQIEAFERAEDREAAFFSLWTAKEACLKATGWGIAEGLDAFVFEIEEKASGGARLVALPERAGQPGDWCIRQFDIATGFCGTVALRAGRRKVAIRTADVTGFVHDG